MDLIFAAVACLVASASLIIAVNVKFQLWKLKAEIQEELANEYTPDILKDKKEETGDAGSGEEKGTDDANSGGTDQGAGKVSEK